MKMRGVQAGRGPAKTTVVLQRDGTTVVINDVPALVYENRGEEYVDEQVAEGGFGPRRRQGRDPTTWRRDQRTSPDFSN